MLTVHMYVEAPIILGFLYLRKPEWQSGHHLARGGDWCMNLHQQRSQPSGNWVRSSSPSSSPGHSRVPMGSLCTPEVLQLCGGF